MKHFLILLLLVGCATSGNKEKNINEVTDDDFKRPRPVAYVSNQDYYREVSSQNASALSDESLHRLSSYSGSVQDNDVITNVAKLCYDKKYSQAMRLVTTEHDRYRENPSFWNQVGSCYMLQGQYRKAILFYNKSLEYEQNYAPALNNMGVIFRKRGEDQRAEVAFKKAIEGSPFAKTPRFNLAQLYLSYGLYEFAIDNFKVLERSEDVEVYAGLANGHLMAGETQQALAYFKRIDEKFYNRPFIGINAALSYFSSGDKRKAQAILRRVDQKNLGTLKSYYDEVKEKVGL